ncbi:MAG: hypothetical protein ACREIT_10955, partial [Tepidisphaeraceae bacterium]
QRPTRGTQARGAVARPGGGGVISRQTAQPPACVFATNPTRPARRSIAKTRAVVRRFRPPVH